MYPSLILSAALIAPAAPIPRDTVPGTPGPAPRVLALKADANGSVRVIGSIPMKVTVTNTFITVENNKQVQKQVDQDVLTSQYFNKTLADYNGTFATAAGTPLTVDEATNRVKTGATVLVSSDGKPVSKLWLRAVSSDTVVMLADDFSRVQPQWGSSPMPNTPAPQLTMLGTDESGKLMARCTSHVLNANNGVYTDDMIFQGKGQFGGRLRRVDYGYYNPQPMEVKVVLKPLADVKFDAYDLTGKLIPRKEVLRRLAAGGMVIVAGDNRMPDETYIKAFHPDVLVLAGPELVLPVSPLDQTKKKANAQPANGPQIQLPALKQPGIIIKGGARIGGNVVLPAVPAVALPAQKAIARPAEKK